MTTTAPRSGSSQLISADRGPVRRWAADLRLGARLAVRTDVAGRLRLLLAAVGIGLSVAVLLLCASVNPGLDGRQARADRLSPAVPQSAPPPGAALFQAHPSRQTYRGQLVSGIDAAALHPGAAPPPGLSSFPAPGELAVSPALADLLSSPEGEALRPRFAGPVTAILSDAGLTAPSDLRFVRGVLPGAAPGTTSSGPDERVVGWAWGRHPGPSLPDTEVVQDSVGDLIRAVVLFGAAVVLLPLLILVSLMARLGSATRGRRTAALRAIGATGPQLSRILAGEALVGAAGGLITGTLGFLAARQLSWIEVGGAGFFPADLTPAPASAVLIAALVPVLATGAALLRPQRPPGRDPAGTGGPSRAPARRRRVPTGWAYAAGVGALVAVQLGPAHPVFGADLPAALIILAGTALLGLLVVPVLLPPALAVATRLVPTRRPVWLLAARRLRSDNGAASRAVTAVSVVVAATVALLPVLAVVDHTIATGYHADQDPTRYRVQIDGASTAELALLTADLRSVPGVQAVAGGSYVWMTDAAMDDRGGSEVFIADCRHIAASMGITDCRSGDVLRVPAYGTGDVFRAGDELQPVGENTTPDSSWTVPDAGVRDVHPVDGAGGPGAHAGIWAPHLIVTPEALGASLDAVLAGSFAFFVVDTERADALDDIRNAAASFGSRAQVTSMTEWAADSGTVQVIATLQTGLALGGSILLLLAFTGLIVVAVEQFVDRRRPLTLAVAAGVPGSLIARSLIAESFVTGLVAAVVGTAVGLPLAAYAAGLSSLPVGLPWWGLVPVAATCILATVAATAATLPALAAVTRIEHLRTS